jgi:hypothetical protein
VSNSNMPRMFCLVVILLRLAMYCGLTRPEVLSITSTPQKLRNSTCYKLSASLCM